MAEGEKTSCENLMKGYMLEVQELIERLDGLRRVITFENVQMYVTINTTRSFYTTLHDSPLDIVEMLNFLAEYADRTAKKIHRIEGEIEKLGHGAEELGRKIVNCLRLK